MKNHHPENMNEWLHLAGSYIWGHRLETYHSKVSGKLEIWMVNGKMVLNSAHANQSYDSIHSVFKYVFDHIKLEHQPIRNILLLGLGVGNVPTIIEEELVMNCKITAIEKDPLMIELGKKYFDIDRFKNLFIVTDDALLYVERNKQLYDLVIVDLFIDNRVPEAFTSENFLSNLSCLLNTDGMILFNMIVQTPDQLEQFKQLQNYFNSLDGVTQILQPIPSNKVLYWQKYR